MDNLTTIKLINLKTGNVYVRREKGKLHKSRAVGITEEAHKVLEEYVSIHGGSGRNLVSCLIMAYCGRTGVNPLDPRIVDLPDSAIQNAYEAPQLGAPKHAPVFPVAGSTEASK